MEKMATLSERMNNELNYWMAKFAGDLIKTSFPPDFVKAAAYRTERLQFRYPDDIFLKATKLSNNSDARLHMILVACVTLLLYKYTGNEDIIIGTSIYKQEVEGDFINTVLMIRNRLTPGISFKDFLLEVRKTIIEAIEHQNYPVEKLLYQLNIPAYENAGSLADVFVLLSNIHQKSYIEYVHPNILFDFYRAADHLEVIIEYNSGLYKRVTVERIMNHLLNIMQSVLSDLNRPVVESEMLSQSEKDEILVTFNDTGAEYAENKTIYELFEEQAAARPNKIAIDFTDDRWANSNLTFDLLNQKANQFARILLQKGVKPDDIVGIMMERSIEMIIGILGILKAGGAYLPIDPEYPEARIQYIINDSRIKIIVTQHHLKNRLAACGEPVIIEPEELGRESSANLGRISNPRHLAYVIYTSGSTGMPKGVMVEHIGVANLKTFFTRCLGVTADDHIVQFAPISFDASVWEMFMSLLNGATLYLLAQDIINDPLKFENFINQRQITIATLPPPYLANLNPQNISSLRTIVAAGSVSSPELVNRWSPKVNYVNAYGPTETTVCATFWKANQADSDNTVPIGKPITNTQVYILDKDLKLLPPGISGEICIGGVGLARGYLGKPELTGAKFVDNPFSPGKKLYRTGDLGRWRPDGNIDFLGRMDQQVKLRGFRIELGEIEFQLLNYGGIKEAVVLAKENENGAGYLAAYIVTEAECDPVRLKDYLKRQLPDYMIPAYFVPLPKMPLTNNGKINREALPDPVHITGKRNYEPPQNELQEKILKIWQEVLRVDQLDINDNFFENGGDSIKAIQVASRLNNYQLRMDIKDLFNYPNIKELSNYIKVDTKKVEQGAVVGAVMLIPIHKWFFENNFTDMHHFNQSILLYNRHGFDEDIIKEVFARLVEHHDALRMAFRHEDGKITGYNREFDRELVTVQVSNFSGPPEQRVIEEEINRIQSSLSLSDGYLFKVALFKTGEGDHLLIVIHHLVIDGVSWRVLCEDLAVGYMQSARKEPIKLPDKTDSFMEWAQKLNEYAVSRELLNEIPYWRQIEQTPVKPLPKDHHTTNNRFQDSKTLELVLTEEETGKLLKQVHHAYNTGINDILLTGLGLAVKEWTHHDQIPIWIEGHGREPVVSDINLTRTVGWFTSMYPIILDMTKSEDISYQIKTIKENLRRIPNGGIGYGILKYLTPPGSRTGLEFTLQPEISFNYLGQFDQDVNSEVFSLSPFSTGLNVSPNTERLYTFEITGIVYDNRLRLAINYNRYEYEETTVTRLMNRYRDYLQQISKHCLSKGETELTPTDLGDAELSLEELTAITDLYKAEG